MKHRHSESKIPKHVVLEHQRQLRNSDLLPPSNLSSTRVNQKDDYTPALHDVSPVYPMFGYSAVNYSPKPISSGKGAFRPIPQFSCVNWLKSLFGYGTRKTTTNNPSGDQKKEIKY